MKYSILINSSPYGFQNSTSAFLFSKALIKRNHQLVNIFFYSEGVFNANKINVVNNNHNLIKSWKKLSIDFNIKLYVCIESAFQRGLILKADFKRKKRFQEMLDLGFKLAGLVTFVESVETCDRILQF